MAKFILKPNAELDLLTPEELRTILAETLSGFGRAAQTIRPSAGAKLDASGNANGLANGIKVFTVPPGYNFVLHRMIVTTEAATFGVPFTGAGCYVTINRGETVVDGSSGVATFGSLPWVFKSGMHDGIYYSNGDTVRVDVFAGPASVAVLVRAQGTLKPMTDDDD